MKRTRILQPGLLLQSDRLIYPKSFFYRGIWWTVIDEGFVVWSYGEIIIARVTSSLSGARVLEIFKNIRNLSQNTSKFYFFEKKKFQLKFTR